MPKKQCSGPTVQIFTNAPRDTVVKSYLEKDLRDFIDSRAQNSGIPTSRFLRKVIIDGLRAQGIGVDFFDPDGNYVQTQ